MALAYFIKTRSTRPSFFKTIMYDTYGPNWFERLPGALVTRTLDRFGFLLFIGTVAVQKVRRGQAPSQKARACAIEVGEFSYTLRSDLRLLAFSFSSGVRLRDTKRIHNF